MELMPHIKALLDDLIKMTKHIDIKRTDLADRYEDNTRTTLLYQQVSEILHGMPSFYTYTVYPREVLNSYGKWVKAEDTSNFGVLEPLTSSENITSSMISGQKMTISNKAPLDRGNIGEGWVKLIGNDSFYVTKTYSATINDSNYNISRPDSEGNYNPSDIVQPFIFTNNLRNSKTRYLYIKDERFNKYVKVDISFISEYIEKPEDMDKFLENPENSSYVYDSDKNGNYIVYVENIKNNYEKIVKDPNVIPNSEIEYLFRYKVEFYFADSYYYGNNEYYFEDNYIIDENKYSRIDNNEYYYTDNDIYLPLYTQNNNGSYIYSEEESKFIELDKEELSSIDPSKLYSKEIESPEAVYYRYNYLQDGLINMNETYMIDDQEFNRYELSGNNFVLYYAYNDDLPKENDKCILGIETIKSSIEFKTYISLDGEEIPLNVDDRAIYYFYEDQEGLYKREEYVTDNNTVFRYTNSTSETDKKYSMSKKEPSSYQHACIYLNTSENNEFYVYERVLTDNQVYKYYRNRNEIPEIYREDLVKLMKDYILNLYCPDYNNDDYNIPIYTGETNRYYRELNGLPPLNVSLYHPKIDRYRINPYYEGTNINPYLYELTDSEVDKMEELGYLKQYQDMYPDYIYLRHLGRHRIDVITARNAAPYDILHINDSEMSITSEMFISNYSVAKNYIFKKYYKPNMFGTHQYYHAYIGFIICVLTLIMCMVKSGEILIENKFMDQETVDLILKSYGFEHTFDSIPLVYRREIAKNILKLIRNKGTDNIYEIIYSLFNISDIEVYKYYFKKTHIRDKHNTLLYYLVDKNGEYLLDNENNEKVKITKLEYENNKDRYEGYQLKPYSDIGIYQVPISSSNTSKDIMNDSNSLNYNDITSSDIYWGVYESDESVKNKILDIPFNYMNSKYITLNNKFNLTELNFNSVYLLNYLLESTALNENDIIVDIEEISEAQTLKNLLVMLFAIQSIRYGFDGNIPSDIVSAATVFKFNLDKSVTGDDGEAKRIIDYYLQYMSKDGAVKALDIDKQIESIRRSNSILSSVEGAIYNNKSDNSVNDMTETYIKNISIDDTLTPTNEASLYNTLINYRENSKNISDFKCFDDLLHCISICDETQKAYKFPNTIWEKMYECQYKNSGDINSTNEIVENSNKMYYTNILTSWNLIRDDSKKLELLNLVDGAEAKELIRLKDDTYIDAENYKIESKIIKNEYGNPITTYDIYQYIEGEWILTDLVPYDGNTYYEHFLYCNTINSIVSTKNAIVYGFDEKFEYVININDLTRNELMKTKDLSELKDRIDIYKKESLFGESKLDLDTYIKDLVESDIGGIQKVRDISSTNIGINNIAYIGHITLDEFVNSAMYSLNGPVMYVEVTKNTDTSENIYDVKIYKKCDYALSYSMYLREMAPDLYSYLQPKSSETEDEYRERINKFSSTIIATIENNIESKKIKERLNLSYVDFSNISKYIRLIINVFKSYSIDLSSMDIIYNIDDINNNRVKIIDGFSTNEKYGIDSNLRLTSDVSYNEKNYIKDIFSMKDELYIEYYSRQFYDVEHNDPDIYYRVNNAANPGNDYSISSYYYGRYLDNMYNSSDEIDDEIVGK